STLRDCSVNSAIALTEAVLLLTKIPSRQQGVQIGDSFQVDKILAEAAPLKSILEVNVGFETTIVT
ncbi:serrate protein, partial [Culex quinquefasciatus]